MAQIKRASVQSAAACTEGRPGRGLTPGSHKAEIRANLDTNSMAAHLSRVLEGSPGHKFYVTRTRPKCLERLVREAVQLANMDPDRIINTHMEFVAPAIQRMTHTSFLGDRRISAELLF